MGYVAGMAIAAQKAAAFTVPVISPATCWPEARRGGAGMDMDTTSYDRRSHIAPQRVRGISLRFSAGNGRFKTGSETI